jgi:hypothetical protein
VLLIVSNGRAAVNRGKRKAGSPPRTQRRAERKEKNKFTAEVAKNAKKNEGKRKKEKNRETTYNVGIVYFSCQEIYGSTGI